MRAAVLAVLGLALLAVTPARSEITGKRPNVLSADTLELVGLRVRLYGIDAPELGQTCRVGSEIWNCGNDARWAAIDRIGNNWVACVGQGVDADGTLAAVCYLGGVGGPELNGWLVAHGWALAYRPESRAYLGQEEAAQRAGKGLWRGEFVAPWIWRDGR